MRPMSRPARATILSLVVILAGAMAGVLLLRAVGAPVAQGPTATATALASAEPVATATVRPSASSSRAGDTAAVLAQIEGEVRDLRDLPQPEIGAPDVITRAQLGDEVRAILDESWTPEELQRANLTLQAMGLLSADQDIRELTARLLEGQVLGFYDYTQRRMVVVSDAGLTPEARVTYAHEYTHALQDSAFDAGVRLDALTDDDAIGAYQALVEGDATLLMFQWAFAHLSPDELGQIGATPLPDMTGIPNWMIQQLQWPYLAGLNFLASVSGMSVVPGAGSNWNAVDEVYANPPASTEQVIHPEKYANAEAPVVVEAPAVADALGTGWEDLSPNTAGEAMISIWLAELGAASPDAAAAGWGGDRQAVARGPNGEWALAWRIVWDSAADAQEFLEAGQQLDTAAGGLSILRPASDETLVLRASSPQVLGSLEAALGG